MCIDNTTENVMLMCVLFIWRNKAERLLQTLAEGHNPGLTQLYYTIE